MKSAQKRTETGPLPPRRKGEATGEKLLQICLKQFQEKGFEGTTMRALAEAAGLSPGAFYYHFPSKEAVVQVFYEMTFEQFQARCRRIFEEEKRFGKRLEQALEARLETFASHRELLIVLSRAAVDPRSELSPFAPGTREIRESTISLFQEMREGSDFRCDKRLDAYLPTLLWMVMMGTIFFWVFDQSQNQRKSKELIRLLTPQIVRLIGFTRFPLPGSVMQPLLSTLRLVLPGRE